MRFRRDFFDSDWSTCTGAACLQIHRQCKCGRRMLVGVVAAFPALVLMWIYRVFFPSSFPSFLGQQDKRRRAMGGVPQVETSHILHCSFTCTYIAVRYQRRRAWRQLLQCCGPWRYRPARPSAKPVQHSTTGLSEHICNTWEMTTDARRLSLSKNARTLS